MRKERTNVETDGLAKATLGTKGAVMATIDSLVNEISALTGEKMRKGSHDGAPGHDGGPYWAAEGSILPTHESPAWMAPAIFLEEGKKKVPSLKDLQNGAAEAIPALAPLIGYGDATALRKRTTKHLLMYFIGLKSPEGSMTAEGFYESTHNFSGALCLRVVDEGLAWVLLSIEDLDVFDADAVDTYLAKLCKALDIDLLTKSDLSKGKFAFIHEEPDCNWKPPPRSFF